ncbi:hypothetical protein DV737_g206, partial [Chaetothyriales sp. CBS 132003]
MATLAASDPDLLSDEQVERLLQEAEVRLCAKANQAAAAAAAQTAADPESLDVIALQETDADTDTAQAKRKAIPRLQHGLNTSSPYILDRNGVAQVNPVLLSSASDTAKLADNLRPVKGKRKHKKEEPSDAGPDFFHMPKTVLSDSLKRDFSLLQLRSVLDPHRHYKKTNSQKPKIPQFSQTGTVIEGPTEFFSARINRKDRSKNFVHETLNAERDTGRFKRKYNEIQVAKTSGRKAHYKNLVKKRRKG